MRRARSRLISLVSLCCVLLISVLPMAALAQSDGDIEAEAWPEFDIWIGLDKERKNRIYVLSSFANAPEHSYEETALGVSWDQRFSKSWSWRAGVRYIGKEVQPPDTDEARGVLDLKWFKELGGGWLLTDRNRVDIRWFKNNDQLSYRYRNRLQLEKPFKVGKATWTGFGSFEMYYDTRFDSWARRRVIAGVSIPIVDWFSIDVFYGQHHESDPKEENAGAIGIAFGLYVYD